jgi:hypothetical protein
LDGPAGGVDGTGDDLEEQPSLVREVLVDRGLRNTSGRGDLIHGGAEIPVLQEQRRRGLEDGAVLAVRTALIHVTILNYTV